MTRSSPRSSRSSASSSRSESRSSSSIDRGRGETFDRRLLEQPTLEAARALIGARLSRLGADGRRVARIVEVEAYIGELDLASHARFGQTARNRVMFGPAGIAYVYLVYGMYDCLNVVTEPPSHPAAVLIRAIEPLEGIELMRAARIAWLSRRRKLEAAAVDRERARLLSLPLQRLASGPGLVTAALSIDRSDTGLDLCDAGSSLRLEMPPRGEAAPRIVAGPRVGIAYAGEPWVGKAWRLAIADNPHVSAPPIRD